MATLTDPSLPSTLTHEEPALTVFVTHAKDAVWIRARAESEDGSIIGDLVEVVRPGGSFLGHHFEWWALLPGKNELDLVEPTTD